MNKHLFLIGGASGCGKTAICQTLAGTMNKIICLDGDSLWNPQIFNMENTVQFYDLWFKLANDISDNGVAVAIFLRRGSVCRKTCLRLRDTFDVHFLTLFAPMKNWKPDCFQDPEWQNAGESAKGFINAMKGMNMKYQLLPIDSKI